MDANNPVAIAVDTVAPTVAVFSPADGANGITAGSNVVLTFSEAIARGTGNLLLRLDSATGALIETFDATTSNLISISGTVLAVDPTQNLLPSTHYYLNLVSGSVQDIAGNSYAGTTAYDFTTGNISPVATGSFGGHYYEVYAEKYTWTDAQAVAKQKGGYLVSITSSAENTFVANLRPSSLSPWIGLYQADFTNEPAGGWVWDSGEVSTYRAWAPGEPNNDFGIEGYAHFFTTPFSFYGWNDFIQSGGVPPLTRTNVAAVGFLVEYGSVLPPTTTTPGLRVIGLNEQFERVAEFGALTSHRLSGPDRAFFTITPGGTLMFIKAPDYELPYDQGKDNAYDVTVTSYKGGKVTEVENLRIQIKEVVITQGTPANTQAIAGRSGYLQIFQDTSLNDRISGGDCLDKFIISSGTDTITDFNYLGANKDWQGNPAPTGQEVLRVDKGATAVVYLSAPWMATSESMNAGAINFNTPGKSMDLTAISGVSGVKILNTGGAAALTGTALPDTIIGGSGKDSIFGGAGADSLLGNAGNDLLSGGPGDDRLAGGPGLDTLIGGDGADWFVFDSTRGNNNLDIIRDFVPGSDKLVLSAKIFGKFTGSSTGIAITAGNLVVGAGATAVAKDNDDYLIYDTGTDLLYYDADGSGTGAPVAFVKIELTGTASPSFGDFLVVS